MSPLERAARALCRSRGDHCNYSNGVNVCDAHGCYLCDEAHGGEEELKEQVRAVVTAIREPSAAMVEAGHPYAPEESDDAWRAMIDALLKETADG